MSQIKITINNRPYTVACDDGQEEHLHKLASFLDDRVKELSDSLGQIGDPNLLLMAGLLVSDELSDAYSEVKNLKEEVARKDKLLRQADMAASENADAAGLTDMVEKITSLAAKMEQA